MVDAAMATTNATGGRAAMVVAVGAMSLLAGRLSACTCLVRKPCLMHAVVDGKDVDVHTGDVGDGNS